MSWGRLKAWRAREGAIPDWAGLAMTGLCLGVVVALGMALLWAHRRDVAAVGEQSLSRQVFWLARAINLTSQGKNIAAAVPELRRAKYEPGVERCQIVDREGVILASSDASSAGKKIPDDLAGALIGVGELEVAPLSGPSLGGSTCYAIRLHRTPVAAAGVTGLAGGATSQPASRAGDEVATGPLAWLLVEGGGSHGTIFTTSWPTSVGCIALAAMGGFWLVYRLVSRSLRPMAAIRQRLLSSADSAGERLALLRVNDSLDQAAAAWNRLIEFAQEMQQDVEAARLKTAVVSTLETYRSERLATVLRQMPYGVLVLEEGGQVGFANPSAARMLGRQDEDLAGKTAQDILPEALRTEMIAGSRGTGRWVDHTLEGKDGATTIRFASMPVDKDAPAGSSVVFMQDVSQFKEMERAQDAFLYHVTHELRTPLTNIRAYAETLAGGVLDDPASLRECYNVISGETERLGRLVEAILNVSQLEVGTARLNFGEVHVDRMIRDAVQDMQAHASAKGIDLRLRLAPKLPVIRGDKERLAVVLTNLVGNAIKYTPSGGQVEVVCTVDPDMQSGREPASLRISVSDTGIGIDPSHHERIFEKFYRVKDEQVESEPGTGLGLAIVKETVRLHGGHVSVESTPGRGSTFHVTLPVR